MVIVRVGHDELADLRGIHADLPQRPDRGAQHGPVPASATVLVEEPQSITTVRSEFLATHRK